MPYVILVGLIIGNFIGAYFTRGENSKFINGIFSNLISEFIGALFVLVFVEKLFEKSEKRKFERLRKRAKEIVNSQIVNVLTAFAELAYVTKPSEFNFEARSIGELFNDKLFETLENSDWSGDTKKYPPRNWATQITNAAKGLKEGSDNTLGLYGQFLEEDEIVLFENISTATGLKILLGADSVVNKAPPGIKFTKIMSKNKPGDPPNNIPQEIQLFIINIVNWLENSVENPREKRRILEGIKNIIKITKYD